MEVALARQDVDFFEISRLLDAVLDLEVAVVLLVDLEDVALERLDLKVVSPAVDQAVGFDHTSSSNANKVALSGLSLALSTARSFGAKTAVSSPRSCEVRAQHLLIERSTLVPSMS